MKATTQAVVVTQDAPNPNQTLETIALFDSSGVSIDLGDLTPAEFDGVFTDPVTVPEPTEQDQATRTTVATTVQLVDIEAAINTTGKFQGKMVFNTTTNQPVFAVSSAAAGVWVDAMGDTEHAPE